MKQPEPCAYTILNEAGNKEAMIFEKSSFSSDYEVAGFTLMPLYDHPTFQYREPLPQRRQSETFDFTHANSSQQSFNYKATVGYYEDGRPGEIFLNAAKITTDMDTSARDAAVLLSFALQHGVDINVMRTSMQRDPSGRALGVIGTLLDILCKENYSAAP